MSWPPWRSSASSSDEPACSCCGVPCVREIRARTRPCTATGGISTRGSAARQRRGRNRGRTAATFMASPCNRVRIWRPTGVALQLADRLDHISLRDDGVSRAGRTRPSTTRSGEAASTRSSFPTWGLSSAIVSQTVRVTRQAFACPKNTGRTTAESFVERTTDSKKSPPSRSPGSSRGAAPARIGQAGPRVVEQLELCAAEDRSTWSGRCPGARGGRILAVRLPPRLPRRSDRSRHRSSSCRNSEHGRAAEVDAVGSSRRLARPSRSGMDLESPWARRNRRSLGHGLGPDLDRRLRVVLADVPEDRSV